MKNPFSTQKRRPPRDDVARPPAADPPGIDSLPGGLEELNAKLTAAPAGLYLAIVSKHPDKTSLAVLFDTVQLQDFFAKNSFESLLLRGFQRRDK